jgi:hypothetical protein
LGGVQHVSGCVQSQVFGRRSSLQQLL